MPYVTRAIEQKDQVDPRVPHMEWFSEERYVGFMRFKAANRDQVFIEGYCRAQFRELMTTNYTKKNRNGKDELVLIQVGMRQPYQ